jgi:hypothetical protein
MVAFLLLHLGQVNETNRFLIEIRLPNGTWSTASSTPTSTSNNSNTNSTPNSADAKQQASDSNVPTHTCNACGVQREEKMLRCSRCKSTYYCSARCQKSHWSFHKLACNDAEALAESRGLTGLVNLGNTCYMSAV